MYEYFPCANYDTSRVGIVQAPSVTENRYGRHGIPCKRSFLRHSQSEVCATSSAAISPMFNLKHAALLDFKRTTMLRLPSQAPKKKWCVALDTFRNRTSRRDDDGLFYHGRPIAKESKHQSILETQYETEERRAHRTN